MLFVSFRQIFYEIHRVFQFKIFISHVFYIFGAGCNIYGIDRSNGCSEIILMLLFIVIRLLSAVSK